MYLKSAQRGINHETSRFAFTCWIGSKCPVSISSATGLAATAIITTKLSSSHGQLAEFIEERRKLNKQLLELDAKAEPANKSELVQQKKEIVKKPEDSAAAIANLHPDPVPRKSGGFFWNIFRSDWQVSLPRFQMVAWTLALIFIFVHAVFTNLNMPDSALPFSV